jgi:hypothetical protein
MNALALVVDISIITASISSYFNSNNQSISSLPIIISSLIMDHSIVSIMDLSDEMIIKIWNNLNKIDVIYSFVGVNKRFNKLVRDPIYTRSIQLIKVNSTTNYSCALSDRIIDRYCSDILPEIHHLIECLTMESRSIERILLSGDYPHLYKLTLVKIRQDFALHYFTGKICFLF